VYSEEQQALSSLRNAKVGSVNHLRRDDVFAVEREVGTDLIARNHLIEPGRVLHDEGAGLCSLNDPNELAIKRVARIVNHAGMITNLRKRLARWATDDDVRPAGEVVDLLNDASIADISDDHFRIREVQRERRRSVRVELGGTDDSETGLPKAL